MKIEIIAEAGVNHNGSLELALRLADAARAAGADFVKYQTFVPGALASRGARKARYQKRGQDARESQLEMLSRLAMPFDAFRTLKAHCEKIGITFLSSPFDLESIERLDGLGMPFWKIPSGEATNLPYLARIAKTGRPIVMSTGMCDTGEIRAALDALRAGGAGGIRLAHCNTAYPTPYEDVNLRAIGALREEFGVPVGYSDHTEGIEIPIAAAALGACLIEKHFTLDRGMEGPDHRASLEPDALKAMTEAIRRIEAAMGTGRKACTPSEAENREAARKSIAAARDIRAGEPFTEENLCCKRPGGGISPMRWNEVLGRTAERGYRKDDLIAE